MNIASTVAQTLNKRTRFRTVMCTPADGICTDNSDESLSSDWYSLCRKTIDVLESAMAVSVPNTAVDVFASVILTL